MLVLASLIRSASGAATPPQNAYAIFQPPESRFLNGDATFATENGKCHIDANFHDSSFSTDITPYTFKIGNQDLSQNFKFVVRNGQEVLLDADVSSMTCDQFVGKTFTVDPNDINNIGSATINALT